MNRIESRYRFVGERLTEQGHIRKSRMGGLAGASALAILVGMATSAHATNFTWFGGTATWETAANWGGSGFPQTAGDGAVFGATGNTTPIISTMITLNSLTFSAGAQSYTVNIAAGGLTFSGAGSGIVNNASVDEAINVITSLTGTSITQAGSGTLTLSGANSFTSATISNGTLRAGSSGAFGTAMAVTAGTTVGTNATFDVHGIDTTIASLAGNQNGIVTNSSNTAATLTVGDSTSTTFAGVIEDGNGVLALTKTGSGTLTLSGANTFTGPAIVNGGTLVVNGSISDPTVNAGATLTGTGAVGATTVNAGGTFAPGNGAPGTSMTVNGNLALQSGARYVIALNPTTASVANVAGSATLGGATVNAVFANGSYISKQYTILTAGNVSGTFNSISNTNLPSNFSDSLSYDATHAYLNLNLNFGIPSNLSGNQQAVGNAITNFFNTNGGIPMVFGALTPTGLSQLSGESATGSQQTTFDAMNQFMGLMTDPFMGRGSGINGVASPTGYAEDGQANAYAARKKTDAFAMFTKAPAPTFVQRWSVWAAGYGGSQSTNGNAALGSNDATSRIAGTAVGADYLFSPDTLAGFALAGGGTNFSVNNLGSGRSDLFQAGAYVRHTEGNAYITAALAYGWQDITTDRSVTAAGFDRLRAEFNANAYSARAEGGYRFVARSLGGLGITPYAAAQFTTFDLPAYAEGVISGTPAFALNYAAKSVTDSRSELGIRADKSLAMQNGILTLRGRLAWAHDFDPDRSIAATFQSLPGASFVVNGAALASDSALTTATAEWKWINGWSAAATFEGEFSNVTQSYAGKGVVRYAW